jgi:hypothetical protein
MQVRNGWRPHGRLPDQQPAALSKDCRFFVQLTRTTSESGKSQASLQSKAHLLLPPASESFVKLDDRQEFLKAKLRQVELSLE